LGLTISQKPGGPVTAPVEISPRQQLVSAPFTIHAYSASLAGTATLATNALSAQKVTGDATLSGGLTVAGTTTLSGPATFAGTTTLADSTILSGNMNILTNSSTTGGGFVPIGGILMWSGAIAPSGWALCDGTQVKGIQTPDLRGRFVLASGSGANLTPRALNAFGGKETHALGVSEMPTHAHPVSVHTVGYEAKYNNDNTEATAAPKTYKGQNNGSQDFPVSNQGGGAAHTNMPPYYVLAFIMRVQ
jgi:microcystin-dependent protein